MRRYDEGKGSLRLAQFRLLVADLRKFKGGGSSVDDVEDAFRKADTDGSGDIDESELMDVLRGLNISSDRSQVRTVMRRYDEGKGSLRLPQFRLLVADLRKFQGKGSSSASTDDVETAFRKADTD